jgi:hypothetical protein
MATWSTFEGALSQSRSNKVIYMRDIRTGEEGQFSLTEGTKISGNLDIPADDVLFLAWRQKQSPSISDKELRRRWESREKT